jgi:hypothetical protein
VASSRWNRAAGAGAALVRLSEVTDWEEGGRTAAEHAARIFRREAAEGERRVLVARRQVRDDGCCMWGATNFMVGNAGLLHCLQGSNTLQNSQLIIFCNRVGVLERVAVSDPCRVCCHAGRSRSDVGDGRRQLH